MAFEVANQTTGATVVSEAYLGAYHCPPLPRSTVEDHMLLQKILFTRASGVTSCGTMSTHEEKAVAARAAVKALQPLALGAKI